ncbi:MAG TPA: L-threonylcarbamoyladenylate synthase [Byssovorax sp.]
MSRTRRVAADADGIAEAAEALRAGRLVVFPTETVYGIGARADDEAAVRAIFEAKGRPATNPLIVHVDCTARAATLTSRFDEAARALAEAFWPGPLTLVLTLRPGVVAPAVTAGGDSIAVRVPGHPIARALLEAAGVPVAAPSANRSESVSPTTVEHVLKTLDGRVDVVIDGGFCARGIESTIVDVRADPAVVLRPGAISISELAALTDVTDVGHRVEVPGHVAAAPGGLARHYAPAARVVVVPEDRLASEVAALRSAGRRVGVIARGADHPRSEPCVALEADPVPYARDLYAALHALDDAGCDVIVIGEPPPGPAWSAVRDRLRRASSS